MRKLWIAQKVYEHMKMLVTAALVRGEICLNLKSPVQC